MIISHFKICSYPVTIPCIYAPTRERFNKVIPAPSPPPGADPSTVVYVDDVCYTDHDGSGWGTIAILGPDVHAWRLTEEGVWERIPYRQCQRKFYQHFWEIAHPPVIKPVPPVRRKKALVVICG